ncbi:hypothetical protein J6590_030805 [Homalodisca vitripennis]|nr:hypothetical protein J6590_030805 [Homalodisca vitripennis]
MLYGDAISDDLLEDECCQDRAAAGHLKSDLTWSSSSVYLWRINLQRNVLVTILALGSTWEKRFISDSILGQVVGRDTTSEVTPEHLLVVGLPGRCSSWAGSPHAARGSPTELRQM